RLTPEEKPLLIPRLARIRLTPEENPLLIPRLARIRLTREENPLLIPRLARFSLTPEENPFLTSRLAANHPSSGEHPVKHSGSALKRVQALRDSWITPSHKSYFAKYPSIALATSSSLATFMIATTFASPPSSCLANSLLVKIKSAFILLAVPMSVASTSALMPLFLSTRSAVIFNIKLDPKPIPHTAKIFILLHSSPI